MIVNSANKPNYNINEYASLADIDATFFVYSH